MFGVVVYALCPATGLKNGITEAQFVCWDYTGTITTGEIHKRSCDGGITMAELQTPFLVFGAAELQRRNNFNIKYRHG